MNHPDLGIHLQKVEFTDVAVVAHSFGGVVASKLAIEFPSAWLHRVRAVAFTDSVHSDLPFKKNEEIRDWFETHARNWVTSDEDLDTSITHRGLRDVVPCVSAGHEKHENTSWAAFPSVWGFIKDKMQQEAKDT